RCDTEAVRGAQGLVEGRARPDRPARRQVPWAGRRYRRAARAATDHRPRHRGGFAYVLEDLRGGDPGALAQALRGLVVAANQDPQLSRVFSTFSATNPSIYLNIDRD